MAKEFYGFISRPVLRRTVRPSTPVALVLILALSVFVFLGCAIPVLVAYMLMST
ncbi:MAG: hypothetical protein GYB68_13775 [Chloroflexi bacterium]|nr:hypothetical protein [Chloroflexota bacterium]